MKKTLTILGINALVIAEAKKLKKNANATELERLDFANLGTTKKDRCIYGQMTGNCFSDRATDLIVMSCKQVFTDRTANDYTDTRMGEIVGEINGKPIAEDRGRYGGNFWSPIEVFIDMPRNKKNGNNERLINFLKGETKTLELK